MVTIRSLDNALKTFSDGWHRLHRAEARHHNDHLPISRLPNDLLVEIFALASGLEARLTGLGYRHEELITLVRLVSVCYEWRGIVYNAPSLWACISTGQPHQANFECLARLDEAPLHLSLDYGSLKDEDTEELNARIFEEVHRWKTVRLHDIMINTLTKLKQRAAPLLEKLDLRLNIETPLQTVNLFRGSASRLRHLTLVNITIPWESDLLSRLRLLHISLYDTYSPSAQEVVQVLQSCPDLTRFTLHLPPEVHPGFSSLETSTIELPQLEYLSLMVHPMMTDHLLRRMRIPSCKYFSVNHAEATGPAFSAATDHLNPRLSSILLAAKKVDIVIKRNALRQQRSRHMDGKMSLEDGWQGGTIRTHSSLRRSVHG
ncbi:hypothetical protein FRB95_012965 [Tulasnella sp. JGI-2019a]|nr:hypothetical protein FRB95_012965 [Tulasnella sp. JGI-2019a]